jgi:hypothetical protein
MNLQTIREAVESRLAAAFAANADSVTIYPWLTSSDVYPQITVNHSTPAVEYHSSFGRGLCQVNLTVEVRTTAADPISAQIALSKFANAGTGETRSIVDALEAVTSGTTPNLDGAVENVVVAQVSMNQGEQLASGVYEFAATFDVQVLARRN